MLAKTQKFERKSNCRSLVEHFISSMVFVAGFVPSSTCEELGRKSQRDQSTGNKIDVMAYLWTGVAVEVEMCEGDRGKGKDIDSALLAVLCGLFAPDAAQKSFPITLVERNTTTTPSTHRGSAAVQSRGAISDGGGVRAVGSQVNRAVGRCLSVDGHFIFLIAASILGISGADHAISNTDDHAEPDDGQPLQAQEE